MNRPPEDFLGLELERELEEIDKQYSRSHQSSGSGKGIKGNYDVGEEEDLLSVLKKTDSQEEL